MDTDVSADSMDRRQTITNNVRQFLSGGPLNWLTALVVLWCALYALIFIYHGACLVLYPFDVDNSEAYLVYQGVRLSEGTFLYPPLNDAPPYLVDNYPPLYPLVTGLGFLLSGPNFHWPRMISFFSTIGTAILLGYWTFRLSKNRIAAFMSGAIYLSFYHVNDWGALARVDALGVLLALAGIVLFEKRRSWTAALPLIVSALFTRQTLFAAPLAIFASLFIIADRKTAFRYLGTLLLSGMILGAIILLLSGGRAWNHLVVYNANEFRFSDVMNYLNQWLRFYTLWGCAPLAIAIWFYPKKQIESGIHSPTLFWFTLFAIGEALLCGKIGSAPNYMLSLVAAASVGTGLIYHAFTQLASREESDGTQYRLAPLTVFLCASLLQLGATWHWPHSRIAFSETPTREDSRQARLVLNMLERSNGPILSDRAGAPLIAGYTPVFQPFVLTQLVREGKWDQNPLIESIQSKKYNSVLLQFNLEDERWDRERFTPEMVEALKSSYALDRKIVRYGSGIVSYYLYSPKR